MSIVTIWSVFPNPVTNRILATRSQDYKINPEANLMAQCNLQLNLIASSCSHFIATYSYTAYISRPKRAFLVQMAYIATLYMHRIAGNFDGFDAFQPDRQKLTRQILKAKQCLVKDTDHPSKYFRQIFEKSASVKISPRQYFPLYTVYDNKPQRGPSLYSYSFS